MIFQIYCNYCRQIPCSCPQVKTVTTTNITIEEPNMKNQNEAWDELVEKEAETLLNEPLICKPEYPKEVKASFRLGAAFATENCAQMPQVKALIKASINLFNIHFCDCKIKGDECMCHEIMTQVRDALKAISEEKI